MYCTPFPHPSYALQGNCVWRGYVLDFFRLVATPANVILCLRCHSHAHDAMKKCRWRSCLILSTYVAVTHTIYRQVELSEERFGYGTEWLGNAVIPV